VYQQLRALAAALVTATLGERAGKRHEAAILLKTTCTLHELHGRNPNTTNRLERGGVRCDGQGGAFSLVLPERRLMVPHDPSTASCAPSGETCGRPARRRTQTQCTSKSTRSVSNQNSLRIFPKLALERRRGKGVDGEEKGPHVHIPEALVVVSEDTLDLDTTAGPAQPARLSLRGLQRAPRHGGVFIYIRLHVFESMMSITRCSDAAYAFI
jgi:hypothetical protein